MMREVFASEHYRVDFSSEPRLIRVTRTQVPQSAQLLAPLVDEIVGVVSSLRPAPVLIDMRLAPGNNDPEFERAATAALRRLLRGFSKVAILVHSAVGRLHFQRMSRESGEALHIFFEEEEALWFLRDPALPVPEPRS